MDTSNAMDDAIKDAGGLSALARLCHVTPQAVWQWRRRLPAERVLLVEHATGGRITRHQLRPDLYPEEKASVTAG